MPYKDRPRDAALQALIDEYGLSGLGALLGMSKQAIYAWPHVPKAHLRALAERTGRSFHQLRPDLYARNGRPINSRRGH